jgi:hypothetical protein
MDQFSVHHSPNTVSIPGKWRTLLFHHQAASYSLGSEDDILFSYSPILVSQHHPAEERGFISVATASLASRKPQRFRNHG